MKKITLSLLLMTVSLTVFCKTWTVNNAGFTFTPASITIDLGDTVNFVIQNAHSVIEVSQANWDANDNTPLSGGFQTGFGGGVVLPAKLEVGIHYYVCGPHASLGMKGIIIVQNTTGIVEIQPQINFSVYPNPSNGNVQFVMEDALFAGNFSVEVYNVQGKRIYQAAITNSKFNIDLSNQAKGICYVRFYNEEMILTKKIVLQ